MFKDIIKNEKGIALLLTLSIVAILTAVTMQIHYQMSQSMIAAGITKDRLILKETAMAGVHAAMGMLAKDRKENDTDSSQEDWANDAKIVEVMNEIPIEGYSRVVSITDEMGKLQVNALFDYSKDKIQGDHQRMWESFLTAIFTMIENEEKIDEEFKEKIKNESGAKVITCSIIDWLDPDEDGITGNIGAEYADYYSDLDPPYKPKNGPITDLDELPLIKGILPEIYYGSSEMDGLSKFVSIYGATKAKDKNFHFPGKININTAPWQVIAALFKENKDIALAKEIVSYREETSEETPGETSDEKSKDNKYVNDLSRDKNWYKNVPGISTAKLFDDFITTSSDIFKIVSKASLGPGDQKSPEEEENSSKSRRNEGRRDSEEDEEEGEEKESVEKKAASESISTTITAIVQRVQDKKSKKWQCKILKWKTE